MAAKIFRINYKSDFILTLNSDAGWMTPFCIKFWTGMPSQAYYVQFDGATYTHCAPVEGEPTKLVVQFDDHHLPIGDLKFQIAYHFTVADFPNDTEDEVINPANITTEIDGEEYQVMLDFNGETAPEIEFSLPAYANEAQRIANEEARIAAEQQRVANEDARIAAEETRQQNEQQRINQETDRVSEFATLKSQSQAATRDANNAAVLANDKAQLAADKAALANEKAQLAADKAALANDASQLANEKAALAQQKAEYAQQQGGYAKDQGDYAKDQGDYAKAQGDIAQSDHERAETDHGIAADDHTQAGNDHTRAESDHGIAADDHTQAGNDHTRAESDQGIAADDHTQAGNDHTRAESDHGIAADDHTRAESDHGIAADDHTRAESDHTRAESDHAAVEVYVDSLGAFDISAYNATGGVLAKYADLTAALGTNGANIPDALRKGGMSVKFVLSSDNKYVQFRFLLSGSFTNTQFANPANWQGVESELTPSKNIAGSDGVCKMISDACQVIPYIPIFQVGYIATGSAGTTVSTYKANGDDSWKSLVIDTQIGAKYYIKGRGGTNARLWAFVDANNIVLSSSSPSYTSQGEEIIAPSNSVKLVCTFYITTNPTPLIYKKFRLDDDIQTLRNTIQEDYTLLSSQINSINNIIYSYPKESIFGTEMFTISGEAIVASTGNVASNDDWRRTDYISFDIRYPFYVKGSAGNTYGLAFYNANKEWVYGTRNYNPNSYNDITNDIPSTAKFFRFCIGKTDNRGSIKCFQLLPINDMSEEFLEIKNVVGGTSYLMVGSSSVQRMESLTGDYSPKHVFGDIIMSGVGGESIAQSSARNGVDAIVLNKSFTIPETTTAVEIGSTSDSLKVRGNDIIFSTQAGVELPKLNPVIIRGIKGNITISNDKYYFTRLSAGEESLVNIGDLAVPNNIENRNRILIGALGYNSYGQSNTDYVDYHKRFIQHLSTNRFLFLTILVDRNDGGSWDNVSSDAKERENLLLSEFGTNVINVREWLSNHGIEKGIELGLLSSDDYPTAQDIQDKVNGYVPHSLRDDAAHLTTIGYKILITHIGEVCGILFN